MEAYEERMVAAKNSWATFGPYLGELIKINFSFFVHINNVKEPHARDMLIRLNKLNVVEDL